MQQTVFSPECDHCKNKHCKLINFCELTKLDSVHSSKQCFRYKKGEIVFKEATKADGLYCIHEGKIKLYKKAADAKEQILRIAVQGEFIGYGALLSNTPYTVTAEVLEDSKICCVSKDVIFEVFRTNANFMQSMFSLLTKTLDETLDKMADIAYRPVRGRIAEALLLLHKSYQNEKNPSGVISINREDLASYVGTVKETAIRVLKDFKELKLIETKNHEIVILNEAGLADVVKMYN